MSPVRVVDRATLARASLMFAWVALSTLAGCSGGSGESAIPASTLPSRTTAPTPATTPGLAAAYSVQALGTTVTVDAGNSTESGGTITGRNWDFGDGSTAQGLNVSHTYANPGDYPVVLTVTDANGNSATKTQTISVPSYRSGFEDGAMDLTCTTREPNNSQPVFMPGSTLASGLSNGAMALRFFWTQSGYDGSREERGTEMCPPVTTVKEAWVGFMFRLPAVGYPMDKSAGMFQIFQPSNCNSWAAMMTIVNNAVSVTHRSFCGPGTTVTLLSSIPRDTWIPVIVHMVASHQNAGLFQVWMNGAPKDAPTYSATNINFGFDAWAADDTLLPANAEYVKFGQYDYDDANFTIGETRTSYYDSIHVIASARADGWDAVNPVGADFTTSLALAASDAQLRTTNRAAAAFDGMASTSWKAINTPAAWLLYGYPARGQQVVTSYAITIGGAVEFSPKDWVFEASNDGVTWTSLDSRVGEVFSTGGLQKSYAIVNATPYHYYRLNVSANNGGSSVEVAELTLSTTP